MSPLVRWARRTGLVLGSMVAGVMLPAAAWAQSEPAGAVVAQDLARSKVGAGAGALSCLCCLVVVGGVAVLVWWLIKRRK